VTCRSQTPPASLAEFAADARLETATLARLAECGALEAFRGGRRDALWDALGIAPAQRTEFSLDDTEPAAAFTALDAIEATHWDYAFTSHSARGHPLSHLRAALERDRLPDAATVRGMAHGARVRYAGLVICRQRPGTAKGVVFMTLEDETGFVNLVIWEKTFRQYELLAKTEPFLGATGRLQVQSGVTHLVVEKLWKPEIDRTPCETKSRDFH